YDLPKIVRLSDDLERLGLADQLLERGLVGRGQHELVLLQGFRAAHEPEKSPVRVIRRRDVVEDHRRRVMVDEVDQVEVALLHVGNVPRDGLKSFGLQRRAQELDGIVARVEHGDRGLAPGTALTHRASVLVGLDSPATPTAAVNYGGNRAEPTVSNRRCKAAPCSRRLDHPARPSMLATIATSSA